MRSIIAGLVVLILAPIASLNVAFSKEIKLTPPQMLLVASVSLQKNHPNVALEIANALLKRDPEDFRALLLKAQAARKLGLANIAQTAARSSWKLAKTSQDKYASSLVMAQVLASNGARSRSQLWLRRAVENAPNAQLRRDAIRDFRYVKSRNPLTTRLSFSARPSSNINNGSKSDTLVIGGLPLELSGDARALSGFEFLYGFSTVYKKQTARDQQWRMGFSLDARSYVLSSDAKRQAPGQKASDYAFLTAEVSLGTTKTLDQGRGQLGFDLELGRNWYGGKTLGDFARVTVARTFHRTRTSNSRYQLSVTRQWRKDSSLRSSTQIALAGYWSKALKSGSVLRWNLGVQNTTSASASLAQNGVSLGGSLSPKEGLLGAQVTYSFGLGARRYDLPSFGVLRADNKASVGVSLFFHQADYYGFAPTLSITAARNNSNISLYDTTEYGLSIGFRSTF